MGIQFVIFDCDGVLVDSETLTMRVLHERVASMLPGVDTGPLLYDAPGFQTRAIVANIELRSSRKLPDGVVGLLDEAVEHALNHELEAMPGVFEALEQIPQPKAIVSNSRLVRVRMSLRQTGLDRVFNGTPIFSAEMVARPKPDPDLYLFAAEELRVGTERCLVVEDSEAGVQAAVAAGMPVIGFVGAGHVGPDQGDRLRAAGAATIVASMAELPAVVRAW